MDAPQDLSSLWRKLSMREIIGALPSETFSPQEKRLRVSMNAAVLALPPEQRALLDHLAAIKVGVIDSTSNIENVESIHMTNTDEDHFMETVSEDCRRERICKFIDATGNLATATSTCAVCAGTYFDIEVDDIKISDLREKKKLVPSKSHPAHKLTEGMLLHATPSSLRVGQNGCMMANICNSCSSYLKRNKTPPTSLANGMWIGDVPLELSILTLPERILVARFFPAAYIVKLYPKKKGARNWASGGCHHALRGNVSMYRLNADQIAHLTSGDVMPPL
jgi:hypothetical protein